MKRLLYFIIAAVLIVSCGDKKEDKELTLEEKLCREWHSTQLSVTGDIYLSFVEGGAFEMYQRIGEGAYRQYRGTWGLDGTILSGKYNDGEDWAAAYEITISDKVLTLTSKNDAAEESAWAACEIPADIKETCVPVVRSAEAIPLL